MKITNKRVLQQIAINHLSDVDFRDFIKNYEKYTTKPYSFLVKIFWNKYIINHDN